MSDTAFVKVFCEIKPKGFLPVGPLLSTLADWKHDRADDNVVEGLHFLVLSSFYE